MRAVDVLVAEHGPYVETVIRHDVEAGWPDDEIIDVLDRLWDHAGHLHGGHVASEPLRAGPMPLRIRRLATAAIAEIRSESQSSGEPLQPDRPTRADVLRARRRWQNGGDEPWRHLMTSKSTWMRLRHEYKLVPWPRDYRDKLAP
jgi:hypothetical protein